jgi:hypothetical protein
MSGQTSRYGYYERIDPDSFEEDQPVSAGRADVVRNNLSHLRDQFTHQRFNISAGPSEQNAVPFTRNIGDTPGIWAHPFFHTWLSSTEPAGLDLHVRLIFNGLTDASIRLRVIPHYKPNSDFRYRIGDLAAPALIDYSEDVAGVTEWEFDSEGSPFIFTAADALHMRGSHKTYTGRQYENGNDSLPEVHMMRFEIHFFPDAVEALAKLQKLYLREFA